MLCRLVGNRSLGARYTASIKVRFATQKNISTIFLENIFQIYVDSLHFSRLSSKIKCLINHVIIQR